MATVTNVSQSSEQSKIALVPFPTPGTVTQFELATLLSLRSRLHQLERQIETAEQSIRTRLEKGCSVEEGDHSAQLKEQVRRNVAWKAVVIRLAERLRMDGDAYCAKVLNSTKPTRTISLIIE